MRRRLFFVSGTLVFSFVSILLLTAQQSPKGDPFSQQQLNSNAEQQRDKAREHFNGVLNIANEESKRGDYDDAIEGYKAILDSGADLTFEMRSEAAEGLLRAEVSRRKSINLIVSAFFKAYPPLGPIVVVVGIIAVFIALLMIMRWLIGQTQRGTLTSFEDLSVEASKRSDSNRVLTSLVLSHFQDHHPVQMPELNMDIMPGAGEPGFGGLSPAKETGAIPGFAPADNAIKIGSVEFSANILVALRRWLAPPNKELRGWLLTSENEATAVAQLVDRTRRLKRNNNRGHGWRAHVTGPQAREKAITDLTAQIIVDMGKSRISTDWKSLRSFHDGILKLRLDHIAAYEPGNISSACSSFEEALTYDPSNWMARFQLALVLCKDGRPKAALEHFAILESIFERALTQKAPQRNLLATVTSKLRTMFIKLAPKQAADATCSGGSPAFQMLLAHLDEYPECPFLILYNKAMALSALPNGESNDEALTLLEQLSVLKDNGNAFPAYEKCATRLTDRSLIELKLYSLSSRAHILASQLVTERALSTHSNNLTNSRIQIEDLLKGIEGLCLQRQQDHWRSLQTARAVGLGAFARVLAAEGCVWRAAGYLHKALAAEPMFVEAYLQLAELFIREREKLSPQWEWLAETWLKRVAVINPRCQHTQLLLALLYSDSRVGRIEEANRILQKMASVPEANLLLAKNALDSGGYAGQVLDSLQRLCHEVRLRAGCGEAAMRELDRVRSSSGLTRVHHKGQLSQLMDLLRLILKEDLSEPEEREQLQGAIRQCTVRK